jgi:hypothetical protein
MGRSRGGLTRNNRSVVDANGLPIHLALTPGEAHDNRLCSVLLSALLPQTMLLADRGYNADWIRELARQQVAWAKIPPKRSRKAPICRAEKAILDAVKRCAVADLRSVNAEIEILLREALVRRGIRIRPENKDGKDNFNK